MSTWIAGLLRRYINNFYKKNYSEQFLELWEKPAWTFDEYLACTKEYQEGHESRVARQSLIAFLSLLGAGIAYLGESPLFLLLLLVVGLRAYSKARQHMLVVEISHLNSMLARLAHISRTNTPPNK